MMVQCEHVVAHPPVPPTRPNYCRPPKPIHSPAPTWPPTAGHFVRYGLSLESVMTLYRYRKQDVLATYIFAVPDTNAMSIQSSALTEYCVCRAQHARFMSKSPRMCYVIDARQARCPVAIPEPPQTHVRMIYRLFRVAKWSDLASIDLQQRIKGSNR